MPDAVPERRPREVPSEEQRNAARAMGQVCMRVLVTWNNRNAPKEEVREKLRANWSESHKEYVRLGLTIVRRIAHLHGATVNLETGEGGVGLLVNILFPALPE